MALASSLAVMGCTAVADFPDFPVRVSSVAAGDNFVCGVSMNHEVLCWGRNDIGQLGTEGVSASDSPLPVGPMESVSQIATGRYHACVVSGQFSVLCWGGNEFFQVGSNEIQDFFQPHRVLGLPEMTRIYAGPRNSCAGGFVSDFFCWGSNSSLQLSRPRETAHSATPVPMVPIGMNLESLAVGERHMCSLDGEGDVHCWGDNSVGQTGLGQNHVDEEDCEPSDQCIREPHRVQSLFNVAEIASASTHTCARMEDGAIQCWGENVDGQVGFDSGTNNVYEPAELVLAPDVSRWTRVQTGYDHSCAIDARGGLYCWGNNYWGQLGVDDDLVERSWEPLRVVGLEDVQEVALGNGTTCATVGPKQILYCWGNSEDGQISFDEPHYSAPVRMGN